MLHNLQNRSDIHFQRASALFRSELYSNNISFVGAMLILDAFKYDLNYLKQSFPDEAIACLNN